MRVYDVAPPPVVPPITDHVSSVYSVAVGAPPPVVGVFTHPGVLLGQAQLDFVKGKLALGLNPWQDGYNKMIAAKNDIANSSNITRTFSSLSWVPKPWITVGRGSGGSPSEGDGDQQADGIAAYTHALIWYYTGNRASAQKAIEILNGWATTCTGIKFDTAVYSDGLLQAGWCGSIFPRSAEIMRYTFTPTGTETALNVAACKTFFANVFIPRVKNGWSGGAANWLQSMAEALMNCAIFNDDTTNFNLALANWRGWTPGSFWLVGDKNKWPNLNGLPISPTGTNYDSAGQSRAGFIGYWKNPTAAVPWPSGLEQETGRDPWHMTMGFGAAINACETARLQGVDLYGEQQTRLVTAMELNTKYLHDVYVDGIKPPTGWPFAANGNWGANPTDVQRVPWEIGYNHFANRVGLSLPNTLALLTDYVRPSNYRAALHMCFETLSHYGTP